MKISGISLRQFPAPDRRVSNLRRNFGTGSVIAVLLFLLAQLFGVVPPTISLPHQSPPVSYPDRDPTPATMPGTVYEQADRAGEMVRVLRVIDGDTIMVEPDTAVRYIGIDTPEMTGPDSTGRCYGLQAKAKNESLVSGRTVQLVRDVSETDRYGRLLRYVYVGNTMINELLVREGYARVSTYPSDVTYQQLFLEAERYARQEHLGLWGNDCGGE
ncbi:hypothetical protein A2Z33_07360 [Candidatus Gottesmanbacteria bacterium RBG_16_52_11]|uniref:TNase-like domain-containing protein n=1 Tax=Candidatus Gottesmanbacteria bacterium RBG_16_52_11 TaxID=1798374 RepID=A0A1F5YXZ5_9BACT|nr:MAG: hypothetical protein A2Z33_07360 [Candidatus Gottesmanbacteria bacterium RBG_16_52_11]